MKEFGLVGRPIQDYIDTIGLGSGDRNLMRGIIGVSKEYREIVTGEWNRFNLDDEGSLYGSLQDYKIDWGAVVRYKAVAEKQLERGNSYVYYTRDENGNNTVPRIIIRTEGDEVVEVRGIGYEQNVELNMLDIAREKYLQLPGGTKFEEKYHDVKLFGLICEKSDHDEELTSAEIRFLYEIDKEIESFGFQKDPKIEEIISKRNHKKDISIAIGVPENQIGTTREEFFRGNIVVYYGDLDLTDEDADFDSIKCSDLPNKFPKIVIGNLDLPNIEEIDRSLIFPEFVTKDFSIEIENVPDIYPMILPKHIGDSLFMLNLCSTRNIVFSEFVLGDVDLDSVYELTDDDFKTLGFVGGIVRLDELFFEDREKWKKLSVEYPHLKIRDDIEKTVRN